MPSSFDFAALTRSVVAVPPLARHADYSIAHDDNRAIVQRLHDGGVTSYLYGGNANFYHLSLPDFAETLSMLRDICPADGAMIPSAGSDYGKLTDQAALLERAGFPLVMMLPLIAPSTPAGFETALRRFVDRLGRGVLLYLKAESLIPAVIARLVGEGAIVAIKYAIPRKDPVDDDFLFQLAGAVGAHRIISGFGEMPAIAHMRHVGLAGYTAGSVCLAPRLSTQMLAACRAQDWAEAERIRAIFEPFEMLREQIDPIGVLHYALEWAGVARTGPIQPALSQPDAAYRTEIEAVARDLVEADAQAR